ncbi:MAG: hypothetical protein ACJAT2_003445 [Bacteriovoracaceae bacterium]|jgi:uncharacterized protein YjbJ (UPF0337 family)
MEDKFEKPKWSEVRKEIKRKFGKLSDSDIDLLEDKMYQLTKKVQEVYCIDQRKAEHQCQEFYKY